VFRVPPIRTAPEGRGTTMSHDLRFQVAIMPNSDFDGVLRRFKHVENLGFDMATTGDHFVDWTNPARPWLEAWTTLAALARETSRLRLAVYVTQIPLRNPAMLARQALTLDHISGGRLEIGLGIGLPIDPAYDMIGEPNWSGKERVARFAEYVEIVDRLLSNEVSSFDGEFYQVKDAVMNPRPVQSPRPPIVIAALRPMMLRHAAKYADNWNSLSFAESFEEQLAETRERAARMDDNLAAIGREPAELRRSYQMYDPSSRASGGAVSYYQSTNLFIDMAESLIEAGMSELGLYYPTLEEQYPAFETIAQEVIPDLKKCHAG
jgi:alkanesulfonate monooxygenase SsuD/methylene tetrahydromethanopterin reductase-like flavin-dependent oxidoreductase (luciferase family)